MLQRRPRLHTLDQLGSISHDISATSITGDGTTSSLDLHHDDDTPRHRKASSLRAWFQRNSRRILTRYAPISVLCLTLILITTRTLGIRLVPKRTVTAASFVMPTHVVYPPRHVQVSAMVMNHARPNLLQHSNLLPTLLAHPNVGEILILHSQAATAFDSASLSHLDTTKIRHVDASQENIRLGLAIRFHYCATEARHEWVLHVDDDMELDATAVNALIEAMMVHPRRIVGHYGRRYNYWSAPFRHGYDTRNIFGPHVEVVLTKVLLVERTVCAEFLRHAPLMDDMVAVSHPHWNGEDIFVNLVANRYYQVPMEGPYRNFAVPDLHVWEADTNVYPETVSVDATGRTTLGLAPTEESSISGNMDRNRIWNVGPVTFWKAYVKAQEHTAYRGRLWYRAKRRLAGLKD